MVVGGAGKVVVRALQRVTPPRCVTEHACLRHLCWSHWKVGVLASIPTAGRVGKDRKWCYRLNCIAPKARVLMWKFSFCRCHQVWGHSQLEWVLNPICLISLWKEERETRRQTVSLPCDDRGRDDTDAAASQGTPRIAGHHQKQRDEEGFSPGSQKSMA